MSIMQTLMSLYAVACEAQSIASGDHPDADRLKDLLKDISDQRVQSAINDLNYLLNSLASITNDLKNMRIVTLTTSADPINQCIWINIDMKLGASLISSATVFSKDSAQNIMDGINMALLTLQPGKNISLHEGNA